MSNNQEKLNEQLFNVVADEKASDEARLKKVKYLVRLGADVNAKLYGKSVLSKAIENEAGAEVQNFLREKGANEWVISKEEAKKLSQGFWDDRSNLKSLEEIKQLLKKGADVNASNKYGDTALMVAVYAGYMEVVKYLIDNGADFEAKDKDGQTALMWAAEHGHLEMVKYLVKIGADVHQKNKEGKTVLDIAKDWKRYDCVKFLEELQPKEVAKEPYEDKVEVLSEHKDKAKKEVLEGKAQEEKSATVKKRGMWQRIFGGRD